MPTTALLMLQLASATAPHVTPATTPTDAAMMSLVHPVPPANCGAKAEEIVVCGKDPDAYRLPKTTGQDYASGPPKAEWRLFGDVKAGIGFAQRNVGGYSSNAVMATIKVPF